MTNAKRINEKRYPPARSLLKYKKRLYNPVIGTVALMGKM
jgi:hypothetical protein